MDDIVKGIQTFLQGEGVFVVNRTNELGNLSGSLQVRSVWQPNGKGLQSGEAGVLEQVTVVI